MNSSGPLRSSLSRHASSAALEAEALRERARAAWHKAGAGEDCWLCVRLGDIPAWDERQLLINLGDRLYGPMSRQPK
jgi:hypothetical protein